MYFSFLHDHVLFINTYSSHGAVCNVLPQLNIPYRARELKKELTSVWEILRLSNLLFVKTCVHSESSISCGIISGASYLHL